MANESKQYFVSYSHKDAATVKPIINSLKRRGVNIWYDAGIDPGAEWQDVLGKKIMASAGVIPFLSKNFIESRQCKKELDFADTLGTPLYPIYIEDCKLTPGLNLQLCGKQAVFKHKVSDQIFYRDFLKNLNVKPKAKAKPNTPQKSNTEMYNKAIDLISKGQYLQAYQILSPLSDSGNYNATAEIADMHLNGNGAQYDPERAIKLHISAAEHKVIKSINALGNIYLLGLGTGVDKVKAVKYFDNAAMLGDCNTALTLAEWYSTGKYVAKDSKKAFSYYLLAAKKSAEAMFATAECYANGTGVKRDPIKAYTYYFKSAKFGYNPAVLKAAECLIEGRGVSQNAEKAKELLSKITMSGNPKADILQARIYEKTGNYAVAFKLYHHAQELGDLTAKLKTADYYFNGYGVVKNTKRAAGIYKSLALCGNLEAGKKYAICCMLATSGAEDLNVAYSYLKDVTSKTNDAEAWLYLGSLYNNKAFNNFNTLKAEDCYLTALKLGNKRAAYKLGKMHFYGEARHNSYRRSYEYFKLSASGDCLGAYHYIALQSYYGIGIQQDVCEAFKMAYRAVNSGYEKTENLLGLCYYRGDGVTANDQKAYKLFVSASRANNTAAINNTAVCCLLGKGIAQDVPRAIKLLSNYENDKICAYTLGQCYEYGMGVDKNMPKAEELYIKSFDMGYAPAGMKIYSLMTSGGETIKKNSIKAIGFKNRAKKLDNYECALVIDDNTFDEIFSEYMLSPVEKQLKTPKAQYVPKSKPMTVIEGDYVIVKRKPKSKPIATDTDASNSIAENLDANTQIVANTRTKKTSVVTAVAEKSIGAKSTRKSTKSVSEGNSKSIAATSSSTKNKQVPTAKNQKSASTSVTKVQSNAPTAKKSSTVTQKSKLQPPSRSESISLSSDLAKKINNVKPTEKATASKTSTKKTSAKNINTTKPSVKKTNTAKSSTKK